MDGHPTRAGLTHADGGCPRTARPAAGERQARPGAALCPVSPGVRVNVNPGRNPWMRAAIRTVPGLSGGMRPTRPVPGVTESRFQPGLKTACLPTRHPAPTMVRRAIRGSAHPIPAGVSAGQAGQQDDRRSRLAWLWLGDDLPRSPFSESHRIVRRFQPGLKAHRRLRSRGQA